MTSNDGPISLEQAENVVSEPQTPKIFSSKSKIHKIIGLNRISKEFESKLEFIKCFICGKVLWNPVLDKNCKKLFCLDCITKYTEGHGGNCKCEFPFAPKNPPKTIEKILDDLTLTCENLARNCKNLVKYGELEMHEDTCEFAVIGCDNGGCDNKTILRIEREEHKKICKYEEIKCKLCPAKFKRMDESAHIAKDCPNFEIECKHCNQLYKRSEIPDHEKDCPKQIICCPHCERKAMKENENHDCFHEVTKNLNDIRDEIESTVESTDQKIENAKKEIEESEKREFTTFKDNVSQVCNKIREDTKNDLKEIIAQIDRTNDQKLKPVIEKLEKYNAEVKANIDKIEKLSKDNAQSILAIKAELAKALQEEEGKRVNMASKNEAAINQIRQDYKNEILALSNSLKGLIEAVDKKIPPKTT